ncbi:TetR/AcrR family transcriptional regulator [Nonomuraea sp. NPDC050663]|uniref:TetR/AcrR family transcriptional regulator n=1 Tax=Nonomuraea sp. NPDC050663 TaxID=3364370 RepID=UPI0037AFBE99
MVRADAERNRARILEVAQAVVAEQGTQASLRDVARRADVGLGTLYRHFPTREALLETLLRERFEELARQARDLEDESDAGEALARWVGEFVQGGTYRGVATTLMATLTDEESALHAACLSMRQAAGRLLTRAQEEGAVRDDVDALDLFALANAVSWIGEQSDGLAERRGHLAGLVLDGLRRG